MAFAVSSSNGLEFGDPQTPKVNKDNFKFATICWLALMQNDEGLITKHPDYVFEKMAIIQLSPGDAFCMLDASNQLKVIEWCEKWNYKVPDEVKDYIERQSQ